MHKLMLFLLLLLPLSSLGATELLVTRVIDGDTVEVALFLPEPLNVAFVRIRGIDAPEKPADSYYSTGKLGRAECDQEAILSNIVTSYLTRLIENNGNKIEVDNMSWGSFGGRIIADAYVSGESITTMLLDRRYAIPYEQRDGHSWCE